MKTVICSTALKIGQLLPYYYSYYQLLNLWAVARFVNQIPCSQTSQWHTHTDFLQGKVSHHFRTRHFPLLQGTTHATHTYRRSSLGQNYYSTTHTGIATHIRISLPPEEVRLLVKECINLSFVGTEHGIVLIWTYLPRCWQSELITEVPTTCIIIYSSFFFLFFFEWSCFTSTAHFTRDASAGPVTANTTAPHASVSFVVPQKPVSSHTKNNNKLAKYNTMSSRCPTSGK